MKADLNEMLLKWDEGELCVGFGGKTFCLFYASDHDNDSDYDEDAGNDFDFGQLIF